MHPDAELVAVVGHEQLRLTVAGERRPQRRGHLSHESRLLLHEDAKVVGVLPRH
jgi:hypothetical protein